MSDPKILDLAELFSAGGGSGWGGSFWQAQLYCPLKYELNQKTGRDTGPAARGGTLFHKLAEIYHNGEWEDWAFPLDEFEVKPDLAAVWNTFKLYKETFGQDGLGEVLGCEVLLEATDESMVGILPFTAKVDMVVRISEDTAAQLEEKFDLVILPGLYLLDWKTKTKKPSVTIFDTFQGALQVNSYQMLWNALHPDDPCLGMLIIGVIHPTKTLPARLWDKGIEILPSPGPAKQAKVKGILTAARQHYDVFGPEYPRPNNCYNWNKPCVFLVDGSCKGYQEAR